MQDVDKQTKPPCHKELEQSLPAVQYEKYEDTAEQVYRILLKHSAAVMMLSCDEAFIDVSGLGDPEEVAATIRAQVDSASIVNSVRCHDLSEQREAEKCMAHDL